MPDDPPSDIPLDQLPDHIAEAIRTGQRKFARKQQFAKPMPYTGAEATAKENAAMQAAMPPFYEEVGRTATAWSEVEQLLDETIWALARLEHDAGACITSQVQSAYNKFFALLALAELREVSPRLQDRMKKLSHTAIALAQKRNRIVHDPVSFWIEKGLVCVNRVSARKKLEMALVPIEIGEYQAVRREINALWASIGELQQALFKELRIRV